MKTKDKIREVAFDIFSTEGFSGTSIRQIAKTVGIRESAIYNHFNSKEDIISEIIMEYKIRIESRNLLTDQLLEKLSNPKDFLYSYVMELIKIWDTEEEKKMLRLLLIEQFRNKSNQDLTLSDLIDREKSVWLIIFQEMMKLKVIKDYNRDRLSDEFLFPLFLIRIEYISKNKKTDIQFVKKLCKFHIEYFWNSIKR
ncbi:TetR/AcrR family transcriptional regulator [Bacteroidota bacterium]